MLPDMPQEKEEKGTFLGGIIRSPFSSQSQTKSFVAVNKIFMDEKGFHTILQNSNKRHFYVNIQTDNVEYLPDLNGIDITAIAWDNSCDR